MPRGIRKSIVKAAEDAALGVLPAKPDVDKSTFNSLQGRWQAIETAGNDLATLKTLRADPFWSGSTVNAGRDILKRYLDNLILALSQLERDKSMHRIANMLAFRRKLRRLDLPTWLTRKIENEINTFLS